MTDDEQPKRAGAPGGSGLSRRGFFRLTAGAAALAALGPGASGCGGGGGGGGADDPVVGGPLAVEPVVFVHLSDSHFGGERKPDEIQDPAALKVDPKVLLTALLGEVVPALDPLATIHTGDLVNEGFQLSYWHQYSEVFAGLAGAYAYPDNYVEILGNHDVKFNTDTAKGDVGHGLTHFTTHSVTGRVLGSPADRHGVTVMDHGSDGVCLIRTNTCESALTDQDAANRENIGGCFTEAQKDALVADPAFSPDAFLNVVLGHHPIQADPSIPGDAAIQVGNDLMLKLVSEAKAPLYLCGHVHAPVVLWVEQADGTRTLMVQASSFGRHGQLTSFFLVAYDQGQPTAKQVYIDATRSPPIAWPQVLVTAPANAALGGSNPNAQPFATYDAPRLRVMVFPPPAPAPGSTVTVKWVRYLIDAGREGPLALATGRLWEGPLDLTGLAPGKHTVTVSAIVDVVSGADHQTLVGSDAIEITVGGGVPA